MNLRQAAKIALEAFEHGGPARRLKAMHALRAALAEADEPVAWQFRTRPTWGSRHGLEDRPWSAWEFCSKKSAEDCWRTPFLNDWAYEARALYAHPPPLRAALEKVDAPPRRKPLTDSAIHNLAAQCVKGGKSVEWALRELERAHGIGGGE